VGKVVLLKVAVFDLWWFYGVRCVQCNRIRGELYGLVPLWTHPIVC
jgi:hypothetical protein